MNAKQIKLLSSAIFTAAIAANAHGVSINQSGDALSINSYDYPFLQGCQIRLKLGTVVTETNTVISGSTAADTFVVYSSDATGVHEQYQNNLVVQGYPTDFYIDAVFKFPHAAPVTLKVFESRTGYNSDGSVPDFVPEEEVFSLVVTKEEIAEAGGYCGEIAGEPQINNAPIADAGLDIFDVLPFDTVQLDGSLSSDPDEDDLTYEWIQISGQIVELENADTATPSFEMPPTPSKEPIVFALRVYDGEFWSEPSLVSIFHRGLSRSSK